MSTGSINICKCESKGSRCLGLWLASGPAVKECLSTADDYSLLHELCPNPGGQLKLKPGTTLCLPSIPRYKPPPPLRRISCFCIHKSLQSIKKKKNLDFSSDTSANSDGSFKSEVDSCGFWSVVRSNSSGIVLFTSISQRLHYFHCILTGFLKMTFPIFVHLCFGVTNIFSCCFIPTLAWALSWMSVMTNSKMYYSEHVLLLWGLKVFSVLWSNWSSLKRHKITAALLKNSENK